MEVISDVRNLSQLLFALHVTITAYFNTINRNFVFDFCGHFNESVLVALVLQSYIEFKRKKTIMSSFIMYFPLALQFITCFVAIDERCLYKETFTNFVTYIDLYVDVLFLDMCRAGHHLVVLIDLIMVIFLIHTLKCG